MNFIADQELIDYWQRETSNLNEKVDDAFREAQNHAYERGFKRGALKAIEIIESFGCPDREQGDCGHACCDLITEQIAAIKLEAAK